MSSNLFRVLWNIFFDHQMHSRNRKNTMNVVFIKKIKSFIFNVKVTNQNGNKNITSQKIWKIKQKKIFKKFSRQSVYITQFMDFFVTYFSILKCWNTARQRFWCFLNKMNFSPQTICFFILKVPSKLTICCCSSGNLKKNPKECCMRAVKIQWFVS